MTKKSIVVVLLICSFFTVMVISIWGKNPDPSSSIAATAIKFYDKDGVEITEENSSADKEKLVTLNKDKDNDVIYTFTCELLPAETTETKLEYKIAYGTASLYEIPVNNVNGGLKLSAENEEKEEEEKHDRFYMYQITFPKGEQTLTKIDFIFNKSTVTRHGYLMFNFKDSHSEDVD